MSPQVLEHPLSFVRHERQWTYQDLVTVIARRLNTAARREKAWRWEHWGVVPDEKTQLALAEELGVPAEVVRQHGWPHWLPAGPRLDFDVPWTQEGNLAVLRDAAEAAMLDRRGFMILTSGAVMGLVQQWAQTDSLQLALARHGRRVDMRLVECFEQRLPTLRQMDAALGGNSIRNLVDSEFRLVTDLLATGSYTESVGVRMYRVAAELGMIGGWASFDAGYHASAERYWTAALRSSHCAGDRMAGANVLKCMSLQRMDGGRGDEAFALARAASEGAVGAPPRVEAMLAVRLARTHAVLGEKRPCERLLVSAEAAMNRANQTAHPRWAEYFDEAEYCAQVAACYRQLSRYQTADRWLTQGLAMQPKERNRDRATYLIWKADTMLGLGDVEHACALVSRAIPDMAATRSVRNRRRLLDLHGRLARNRMPAVAQLAEQLRAVLAA